MNPFLAPLIQSRREVIISASSFLKPCQDPKKHPRLPAEYSSRCCWLCFRDLLPVLCRVPFDQLQIEYKNRVKDRDQERSDESSDGESTDLGIAQRFPERATFECAREQGKDRCAHGDHHGSNALNPGIRKSTL